LYQSLFQPAPEHSSTRAPIGPDVHGITDTIRGALAAAGLTDRSGLAQSVTSTIDRALASAGLVRQPAANREHPDVRETVAPRTASAASPVLDPPSLAQRDAPPFPRSEAPSFPRSEAPSFPRPHAPSVPRDDVPVAPGEFITRAFKSDAGARAYKLYVPSTWKPGQDEVPLLIMLHGCTQDPDDFAAGTRMNVLAEQHGFIVAYPAQPAHANSGRCWNWFRAQDQARDAGEPALIAGITREIVATHRVDPRRIFVAGLSAGAAMAVILAATYPELYAAVGVHSGLPYASAHDMASAFAAMQGHAPARGQWTGAAHAPRVAVPAVPTIIFHGDRDTTVAASNADAIAAQVRAGQPGPATLHERVEPGEAGGRSYTRTVLADGANPPLVEQWTLHGSGHAWSGGDSRGSFTEGGGPDASAEMVRFFLSQRRAGNA
jgi:poly(hydroxyalkanoate) depolymerase family esterase